MAPSGSIEARNGRELIAIKMKRKWFITHHKKRGIIEPPVIKIVLEYL